MNLDDSNYNECINLREELILEFSQFQELLSFEISPMLEASDEERSRIACGLFNEDSKLTPEERLRKNRMMGRFSKTLNVFTAKARLEPVYSFCYAHDNGLLVDPYGDIFPCLLAIGKDELSIGRYFPNVEYRENSIRNRNIDTIPECLCCRLQMKL